MFANIKDFFAISVLSVTAISNTGFARAGYVIVDEDVATSQEWHADMIYLVAAEVHILQGVTLRIGDGADVRIINGRQLPGSLGSNALVFDTGSNLIAKKFQVAAADEDGNLVSEANNAGIWFLGSARLAAKDGLEVTKIGNSFRSSFKADVIETYFLGRPDKDSSMRHHSGDDDSEFGDDIDGISLLGIGKSEWRIKSIKSVASGDDGFDVTNSRISVASLDIENPTEDGMNISSSNIEVKQYLRIDMTRSKAPDRGLFDFEVDDGPTRVNLHKDCIIDLAGYFGDELVIESTDMPMPSVDRYYRFAGSLDLDSTEIYLNDEMNPQTLGSVNSGQ